MVQMKRSPSGQVTARATAGTPGVRGRETGLQTVLGRGVRPATPKAAAGCCGPVDGLLDPGLFKALGDPTRLALLACLMKCGRACSVGEIAECCSVDLSVVSRHLQVLARAGAAEARKQGREVFYAARYEHLAGVLRDLAAAVDSCCPEPSDASTCRGACGCEVPSRKGERRGER